jgi:hypothetical protein
VLATATPYERPDAGPYLGPDVQALPSKPYHMGLLVTGDTPEAVAGRLQELAERAQRELSIHI